MRDPAAPSGGGGPGASAGAAPGRDGGVDGASRAAGGPEAASRGGGGLDAADAYGLIRVLASPLVAVTTRAGARRNGMISDSAMRGSLAPRRPRVALFVHKFNHTHGLILESGVFALHLLRDDQWELVRRLGFASGRDGDKLEGLAWREGETGAPLLEDCYAALDCRVANRMDAGASTFFLGDVVGAVRGTGDAVLTAAAWRAGMPEAWRAEFEARLRRAQAWADEHSAIAPHLLARP
jgi:flavin reductase (DIM6/NTAB) family NADH-FMN oxidoreductase RutF